MRIRYLRWSLLLCFFAALFDAPSPAIAEAQAQLTVKYRLVSSSQVGTTMTQTVEFQITNHAADPLSNVVAAVLLASSSAQRVDTIVLGNILGGQTFIFSRDFVGSAEFITEAFSLGRLTLSIEYDDAAGVHHSVVVTAVRTA